MLLEQSVLEQSVKKLLNVLSENGGVSEEQERRS